MGCITCHVHLSDHRTLGLSQRKKCRVRNESCWTAYSFSSKSGLFLYCPLTFSFKMAPLFRCYNFLSLSTARDSGTFLERSEAFWFQSFSDSYPSYPIAFVQLPGFWLNYLPLDDSTILSEPCKRKSTWWCSRSQLAEMVSRRDSPTNRLSGKHNQYTRRSSQWLPFALLRASWWWDCFPNGVTGSWYPMGVTQRRIVAGYSYSTRLGRQRKTNHSRASDGYEQRKRERYSDWTSRIDQLTATNQCDLELSCVSSFEMNDRVLASIVLWNRVRWLHNGWDSLVRDIRLLYRREKD